MKKNIILTIVFILLIIIILILSYLLMFTKKDQEPTKEKIVRKPAVAGTFYPGYAEELEQMVDQFLQKAEPEEYKERVLGLILPHAGYVFSGQVAAYGVKNLVNQDIDTIILIGNSHHERFDGISVFNSGYYKTPLGEVQIDSKLAEQIMSEHERIFFRQSAHTNEHGLEVELPFLQKTIKNFKIVPIIFGNSSDQDYKILAKAISKHIKGKNVLVVASSDLSHYPSWEDAKYADSKTIEAILTGDTQEVEKTIQGLEQQGIPDAATFACGSDAVKTVMSVAKELGAQEIKLFNYANSGDVSGDRSNVVGYTAIGFLKEQDTGLLNKSEQQELLRIARTSVETFITSGRVPEFKSENPKLNQNLGAFVTLKEFGHLRGCIGRFSPTDIPLYKVVSKMAIAAATEDARFIPVVQDELKDLHYEISVLSNLNKIDNWKDIELGKHGVQIQKGRKSGVFLPQVATDNNWGLEKFMGELCSQKVGLSQDCWKNKDVDLYIFTAQVFEEQE